jgi:hypothetical protein
VIALLTVHPLAAKGRSERLKGAVRDGLRYARSRQQLWLSLWMTALIGLLAFNFAVILPELARKTFHGSGGTYGLMDAAAALVFCLQRSDHGSMGLRLSRYHARREHPHRVDHRSRRTTSGASCWSWVMPGSCRDRLSRPHAA